MTKARLIEERFWEKVDRRGPDECWEWKAGKTFGYGTFLVAKTPKRKFARSNRMAWFLAHGAEPEGMVCHSCDNPGCCNPNHLFVGTCQDNVNDMMAKGRHYQVQKTHCPQGHEYTPENTYSLPSRKSRYCRACNRKRTMLRLRAKRAEERSRKERDEGSK